jgi:hypothetical protein
MGQAPHMGCHSYIPTQIQGGDIRIVGGSVQIVVGDGESEAAAAQSGAAAAEWWGREAT